MSNVLAIDIGTSSIKATIVNENMESVCDASIEQKTFMDIGGKAEQNPIEWWNSICKVTRLMNEQNSEALKQIEAIGLSGLMMGLVAVDKEGDVLRPALIHADTRAILENK